jgi:hypothetical protein
MGAPLEVYPPRCKRLDLHPRIGRSSSSYPTGSSLMHYRSFLFSSSLQWYMVKLYQALDYTVVNSLHMLLKD